MQSLPEPRSLADLQKLTPAEASLWAAKHPEDYLKQTTPPPTEPCVPLYYRVMKDGRAVGTLDQWQYRTLTTEYEAAIRAIQQCASTGKHSRGNERRCDCWRPFRDFLHAQAPGSSLAVAAEGVWDQLEAFAQQVKKSDTDLDRTVGRLATAVELLQATATSAAKPAWLDTRRPEGSKTTQRLRDAAKQLGGKD